MAPKVLVTCRQMQVELPEYQAALESDGFEVLAPPLTKQQFSAAEMIEMLPGVVGLIAGDDDLSREVLEAAGDLRVLVRWGIGMDSVDREAAETLGITVTNTPGVFNDEVADAAFGYVLVLARRHHIVDREVRAGRWPKYEGLSLTGRTLGIVGYGGIGRAIARRGIGFGMVPVAYDPYVTNGPSGVDLIADVENLLASSDVVVIAAPSTPETYRLINKSTLAMMKRDALLVNVARGPLVDERALVEALETGALGGAGLDVFETEPLPMDSRLRSMPNVVLGAHNGSNTREGVRRASAEAVRRLRSHLSRVEAQ